jgi:hypothetical protein
VRAPCLADELARVADLPGGATHALGLVRGGLVAHHQRLLVRAHRHDDPPDWCQIAAEAVAAHPLDTAAHPGVRTDPAPTEAPADPLVGLGFTEEEAHVLRTRTTARSLACWQIGDVLVRRFGPGGVSTVRDGSQAKLRSVASLVGGGTSVSFLAAARTTAAAWPVERRRSDVAWNVHRKLSARPDRFRLMTEFVCWATATGTTPSRPAVEAWLHHRDGTSERPRATKALSGLERAIDRIERCDGVDLAALGALAVRLNRLIVGLVEPEARPLLRAIG